MSEDQTTQASDTTEQAVWDQVVNMIYQFAQMAQKLRFNKYKLDTQLETNIANNHRPTINQLENRIIDLTAEFHKHYKTELQVINNLSKIHATKPRILLILDATKDKLQTLLTFNELKKPTLTELKSKIQTSQIEPTKVEDVPQTHTQK